MQHVPTWVMADKMCWNEKKITTIRLPDRNCLLAQLHGDLMATRAAGTILPVGVLIGGACLVGGIYSEIGSIRETPSGPDGQSRG